jgi:hypothetical protein
MDLDTFLTILYVMVDDWCKGQGQASLGRRRGEQVKMSDSEVLTVAMAGQWRGNVPWASERGVVRYMQTHGRGWFPRMLGRSAFNERVRQLWGTLVQLQSYFAQLLGQAEAAYEVVDCMPLPACSLAQMDSHDGHWLWWSTLGRGGNQGRWFFGEQLLMSVTATGVITGWLLGPAEVDDRWLMQVFVSTRAQHPELTMPARRPRNGQARELTPPVAQFIPLVATGTPYPRPYLADQGFNGKRWATHWRQYQAQVITIPPANAPDAWSSQDRRWLKAHRQVVETVFARLVQSFALQHLNAHSRWGQLTRLAAITATYNFALWLNHQHGRPFGALATLIC